MYAYRYPAEFTPAIEGGFVATFPDVPKRSRKVKRFQTVSKTQPTLWTRLSREESTRNWKSLKLHLPNLVNI